MYTCTHKHAYTNVYFFLQPKYNNVIYCFVACVISGSTRSRHQERIKCTWISLENTCEGKSEGSWERLGKASDHDLRLIPVKERGTRGRVVASCTVMWSGESSASVWGSPEKKLAIRGVPRHPGGGLSLSPYQVVIGWEQAWGEWPWRKC